MERIKRSNDLRAYHKWQVLNATTLKFLAVILMVMDHIGVYRLFACSLCPLSYTFPAIPFKALWDWQPFRSHFITANVGKA